MYHIYRTVCIHTCPPQTYLHTLDIFLKGWISYDKTRIQVWELEENFPRTSQCPLGDSWSSAMTHPLALRPSVTQAANSVTPASVWQLSHYTFRSTLSLVLADGAQRVHQSGTSVNTSPSVPVPLLSRGLLMTHSAAGDGRHRRDTYFPDHHILFGLKQKSSG